MEKKKKRKKKRKKKKEEKLQVEAEDVVATEEGMEVVVAVEVAAVEVGVGEF